MWANNGDILSRQYAGTNALKVGLMCRLKIAYIIVLINMKNWFQGGFYTNGRTTLSWNDERWNELRKQVFNYEQFFI